MQRILFVKFIFIFFFTFFISTATYSADKPAVASYYYPPITSSLDPNVGSREAFLKNRDTQFYNTLKGLTPTAAMTLLAPGSGMTNGPDGLNDYTLGGVNPHSPDGVQRQGSAQLLQIALFQGLSQFLPAAIATVKEDIGIRVMQFRLWVAEGNLPNGDVKQRIERGDIAWEAWLLNQAGAYFTSAPGKAKPVRPMSMADLTGATTQGLMEAFNTDYVEALSANTVWPTTGYNKEVAQGLHPAYMIGIYGEANYSQLYPSSYKGFFIFWNDMLMGQSGSYEVENTPSYGNFNVSMVMQMGLGLNRLIRPAGSTDAHAFISDSVDMPRIIDRFVSETMSNGNALNYNKAISNFEGTPPYAFNNPENSGPFNLKMGYAIFKKPAYLYMARKLEQFLITTGTYSKTRLDGNEFFPAMIQHYDVLNVPAPPASSVLTQMRISPSCYNGLLLCRGAPQKLTQLIPSKIMLQTGQTDFAPYAVLSIAGAGQHANLDQRMTLENTSFNGAFLTARPGRPCQVNQSNSALVAPTNLTFPVWTPIKGDCESGPVPTDFYTLMGLNPSANNYVLASASAQQMANGDGYGELTYSQYLYKGYHAKRQVILRPNGILLVKDSIWKDSSATVVANGGVTYRLWPRVLTFGYNWALQAPLNAISSSQLLTSTVSTLFYISYDGGRRYGMEAEPLTNAISDYKLQTLTTFYAYDNLADGNVHVIVTALLPLVDPTTANLIAEKITVSTNASGMTTVTIPDMTGNIVETFN
jgi:hypothetical protein